MVVAKKPPSPYITLLNGVRMPQVGLGTWQAEDEEVKAAVHAAIAEGYHMFDTAEAYENEAAIGTAIREAIAAGTVTRDEIFITTKAPPHTTPATMEEFLRGSLERLGMDSVDLYLQHIPACMADTSVTVEQLWAAMEGVYSKGLARSIGVSNYSAAQIERVMRVARVPIHNCQIELHLYLQQRELVALCETHSISVTSYSTLGSQARFAFNKYNMKWNPAHISLEDPVVIEIAKQNGRTPAQVLLRWALQQGVAVIPKSSNPKRIAENFDIFDFTLSCEDMARLATPSHRHRLFGFELMIGHPEDSFAEERK